MPFFRYTEISSLPGLDVAVMQSPHRDSVASGHCGDLVLMETHREDAAHQVVLLDVTGHGQSAHTVAEWLATQLVGNGCYRDLSLTVLGRQLHDLMGPVFARSGHMACGLILQVHAGEQKSQFLNAAMPDPYQWDGRVWQTCSAETWHPFGCPATLPMPEINATRFQEGSHLLLASDGVHDAAGGFGQRNGTQAVHRMLRNPGGVASQEQLLKFWKTLKASSAQDWLGDDTTAVWLQLGRELEVPVWESRSHFPWKEQHCWQSFLFYEMRRALTPENTTEYRDLVRSANRALLGLASEWRVDISRMAKSKGLDPDELENQWVIELLGRANRGDFWDLKDRLGTERFLRFQLMAAAQTLLRQKLSRRRPRNRTEDQDHLQTPTWKQNVELGEIADTKGEQFENLIMLKDALVRILRPLRLDADELDLLILHVLGLFISQRFAEYGDTPMTFRGQQITEVDFLLYVVPDLITRDAREQHAGKRGQETLATFQRYLEGWSHEELAEYSGVSTPAIYGRIATAQTWVLELIPDVKANAELVDAVMQFYRMLHDQNRILSGREDPALMSDAAHLNIEPEQNAPDNIRLAEFLASQCPDGDWRQPVFKSLFRLKQGADVVRFVMSQAECTWDAALNHIYDLILVVLQDAWQQQNQGGNAEYQRG